MRMFVSVIDRDITLKLGMGGALGSCIEVRVFMANFYRVLAQYREEIAAKAAPLEGMHPITAQKVDLSLGMFVDDLLRLILLDDVSKAVEESNEDTCKLDNSIVPWRYAQNRTKAEITANLRSNARARDFLNPRRWSADPLASSSSSARFLTHRAPTSVEDLRA